VDPRLHHLQGKAEGVTPTELQQLLREFYLERLGLLMRHERSAQVMGDYDINNAYQYVLAREETHVSWVQHALLDLGAEVPPDPAAPAAHERGKRGPSASDVAREDTRLNEQFIEKWRARVEAVTHARHKGMLKVILGEMAEQRRFFEQASAGRTDLLGKALPINERVGEVLPTRWIE
jgi:hypothetical protein